MDRRARFVATGTRAWTEAVAVFTIFLLLCSASVAGATTPGWCRGVSTVKTVPVTTHTGLVAQKGPLHKKRDADGTYEYFSDFIISLSCPGRGEKTLLCCDIVLSVRPGVCLTESRATIRRIIYRVVTDARNHCSGSYEMRKELQTIIREKINESFGSEVVKDVYFEKFVIL